MTKRPDKIKRPSRDEAMARALKTVNAHMRPEDTREPLTRAERPDFTPEMLILLRCAGNLFSAIRSSGWTLEMQPDSRADVKIVVELADAAHNLTLLATSLDRLHLTGAGIRATMHDANHLMGTFGALQGRIDKGAVQTSDLGLTSCIEALRSIHNRLDTLN